MATRLLAITGPLRKSEFSIEHELSIGSSAKNAISLPDLTVSPEHCRIVLSDGRFILDDLDSRSGTYVNGIPIVQRTLESGDEVTVGSSVFLFIDKQYERAKAGSVPLIESTWIARKAQVPPEQLQHLQPESLAALPKLSRMARTLSALLQISKTIGSLRDEQSLPWQLLGLSFDVIPAERGAILLLEEDSHEIRSEVAWDRATGRNSPFRSTKKLCEGYWRRGVVCAMFRSRLSKASRPPGSQTIRIDRSSACP